MYEFDVKIKVTEEQYKKFRKDLEEFLSVRLETIDGEHWMIPYVTNNDWEEGKIPSYKDLHIIIEDVTGIDILKEE